MSEQQYRVELEFSLLQIDGPIIAASDKAATNTARGSILDLEGLEVEKPLGRAKAMNSIPTIATTRPVDFGRKDNSQPLDQPRQQSFEQSRNRGQTKQQR